MGKTTERSFEEISGRLDEIIAQVRSKDTSLERSLDLFDEAIELGSQAVEMVDSLDLSPAEEEMLEGGGDAVGDAGTSDGDPSVDVAAADASGAVDAPDAEGVPEDGAGADGTPTDGFDASDASDGQGAGRDSLDGVGVASSSPSMD